jgi:hypothetical protein
MSEYMPGKALEYVPSGMPNGMQDRMSESMPE